jgi:hypothetical protein
MIYGEGEKAFSRLQHEIIKGSTDQSLFAWSLQTFKDTEYREDIYRGVFAQSPANFVGCGNVVQTDSEGNPEFSLNNQGLRIEVDLIPPPHHEKYYTAYLNCKKNVSEQKGDGRLGILLDKIRDDQYIRVEFHVLWTNSSDDIEGKWRTSIYITEPGASSIGLSKWTNGVSKRRFTFNPLYSQCREHGFILADKLNCSSRRKRYFCSQNRVAFKQFEVFILRFVHEINPEAQFLVIFGTSNNRVWTDIEVNSGEEAFERVACSYLEENPDQLTNQYSRRFQARESIQDRATAPLQHGLSANVVIKKVIVSGSLEHFVDITITKPADIEPL